MKTLKYILTLILCITLLVFGAACKEEAEEKEIKYDFSISRSDITLEVNDTFQLFATYGPHAITFSSLDEEIATVSADGIVTAKAEGTTYVKVSAADDYTTCKVIVKNSVYGVEIDGEKGYVLANGASKELRAVLYKDGEKVDGDVTFLVDKPEGLQLVQDGNKVIVIAKTEGSYVLTVTGLKGSHTNVNIKVLKATATVLNTPALTISGKTVTWTAISGATAYFVKCDDGEWIKTTETSCEITENVKSVYVYAACDNYDFYDGDVAKIVIG